MFDGFLPSTLPNANMLIVNPPSDTSLFKIGAEQTGATEITVKADDPRTRFLKFNDVNILKFKALTSVSWADVLVNSKTGPLVLAGDFNGHRVAVIPFDLHDTDLPLKIAWPILLANLTEWYKAPQALHISGALQPGQTVTIQPSLLANRVRVTRPDGVVKTLNVDQPVLVYADTPMPGIYSVEIYQDSKLINTELFAVNLFDENESRIAPRTPTFGSAAVDITGKGEIGQREFWPYVALAALLLLMLEWLAYHRGLRVPTLGGTVLRRFARRA